MKICKQRRMRSSNRLVHTHSMIDDTGAIVSSQNPIDTHVQGGRGLEGVLLATEGGERQDPQ